MERNRNGHILVVDDEKEIADETFSDGCARCEKF